MIFSRFLRYFVAVAEAGSIRKASEQLYVSGSSINRQILNVEEELGIPLFERQPGGLKPTAAGELLLHAARRWHREQDQVKRQMEDLKGLRRGHVRIAVIEALSKGLVPDIIAGLHLQYPGISFSLDFMDNQSIVNELINGDVDLGIVLSPHISKDLQIRASLEAPAGLVLLPDHPLAGHQQLRFSEVAGLPMIMPGEPLALADYLKGVIHATGSVVNIPVTTNNVQMIKSLVIKKAGVGVLSWLDVIDEVKSGELAFVKLTDPLIKTMTLAMAVTSSRQLSMAAGQVVEAFERQLHQLRWTPVS